MKRSFSYISALILAFATAFASVEDLPVIKHNGVLCHYYEVQPKETIYSLERNLGISREELLAANPQVKDGLKANTTLYFPVKPSELGTRTITHKVKKGETIYGLSKQFGVSTDELIAQNPSIKDGGLVADKVITLTLPSAILPSEAADVNPGPEPADSDNDGLYLVKENETFYSIAHAHGLTVSQLEAANPMVGVLKAGDRLVIPAPAAPLTVPQVEATPSVPETPIALTPVDPDTAIMPTPEEVAPAPEIRKGRTNAIAVMLPFMLSQKTPDKAANRYTEFFKGLLIAADSLRNEGEPVNIYAFDTAGSIDSVRTILNRPELAQATMIIAPDKDDQLAAVSEWGRRNNVMVLNTFVVRDDSQLSNPVVMQANMPHGMMYDRAIDGLVDQWPDHQIVVLKREDGPTDHDEFVAELHQRLDRTGNPPLELTFTGELKVDDLNTLPTGRPLVFIPISGKQAEFNKIVPALLKMKEAAENPDDVLLFGYPEWITFRGKTLDDLKAMNTTVYSRFYNDDTTFGTKDVEDAYARWFGGKMETAVPRQGLLGFDVGMMAIRALRRNHGDFHVSSPLYNGVQNGFNFYPAATDENSGWVNNVLYFVNFRPSGLIERTML